MRWDGIRWDGMKVSSIPAQEGTPIMKVGSSRKEPLSITEDH